MPFRSLTIEWLSKREWSEIWLSPGSVAPRKWTVRSAGPAVSERVRKFITGHVVTLAAELPNVERKPCTVTGNCGYQQAGRAGTPVQRRAGHLLSLRDGRLAFLLLALLFLLPLLAFL